MIHLRWQEGLAPSYMTEHSAAADLRARDAVFIPAGERRLVPTGVWIDNVAWDAVPMGTVPELQIRARSGLSLRSGLMLANGIGTIDADYRDEIMVILYNSSKHDVEVPRGERIAQMALGLCHRLPGIESGGARTGGFGSTGQS